MDEKHNKRGFSGLSDMASDVSATDGAGGLEPCSPPPKSNRGDGAEHSAPVAFDASKNVRSNIRAGNSGLKWIIGIGIVILVIWFANMAPDSTKKPTYNPPSPQITLERAIESGKRRATEMEAQIEGLDSRLEECERRMVLYKASGKTDEYNMLVPSFNVLVNERNNLYEQYSRLVDEVNANVNRYNAAYR